MRGSAMKSTTTRISSVHDESIIPTLDNCFAFFSIVFCLRREVKFVPALCCLLETMSGRDLDVGDGCETKGSRIGFSM